MFIRRTAISLGVALLLSPLASAETWSDSTGQFKIEADFVGVEGRSIVLKKADGSEITVPIARLSVESRALAKAKYEALMNSADKPAAPAVPEPENVGGNTGLVKPERELSFTPPQPPAIAAMPTFPDNMTPKETMQFAKTQLMAGHPEVFWYALPADMRDALDDESTREALNPFLNKQAANTKQYEDLVFKAVKLAVTKKEFILNSPMLASVPPEALPLVRQGYDPAVGLVYEVADLGFSFEQLQSQPWSQIIDHYGPRIGAHLKQLMPMIPADVVDAKLNEAEIVMVDETHAIVKAPKAAEAAPVSDIAAGTLTITPERKDTHLVKYQGRWIPQELYDQWDVDTQRFKKDMIANLEQAEQENAADVQGAMMMAGMFAGMANAAIDQLLAANTQAEFDQTLMGLMTQMNPAAMMNPAGAGGPGGLGPAGPGAFPPGFPPGGVPEDF